MRARANTRTRPLPGIKLGQQPQKPPLRRSDPPGQMDQLVLQLA
jgi:hypothetical protein